MDDKEQDLIERLRANWSIQFPTPKECADEIDRLRRELAEARGLLRLWRDWYALTAHDTYPPSNLLSRTDAAIAEPESSPPSR